MNKLAFQILRVGIGMTFLWISILIFMNPAEWGAMIQPWAISLLPVSVTQAMIATAILDALVGIFLLINVFTWLAAFLGALHLVVVLTTTGITGITIRDIGLLTAATALFIGYFPETLYSKIASWRKGKQ